MKTIIIQNNELSCERRPTTQEDNFAQIYDKYELFYNNNSVGNLVKYYDGNYAVFHEIHGYFFRYDFNSNEIIIIY